MIKRILLIVCTAVLYTACTSNAAGEYFPFLFQRTMYTDNLGMSGGWWANPALPALIPAPYVHTANALPLGDSLLISSFRLFVPIAGKFVAGLEILGAGGYKTGSSSSQTSSEGFSFQSHFAFERPRFQLGAAVAVPYLGNIGAFGTIGSDLKSYGSGQEGSVSPGVGFGWLSVPLARAIELSAAFMFIHHDLDKAFWESGGKLGLRFEILDSSIAGSAEYSFSLERDHGFGVFTANSETPPMYETFKILLSAGIFQDIAVLAGFSTDIKYEFSNGYCIHTGLELRESADNPFQGGYDIGFRFGYDWIIIHRIWLGLNLRTFKQLQGARK